MMFSCRGSGSLLAFCSLGLLSTFCSWIVAFSLCSTAYLNDVPRSNLSWPSLPAPRLHYVCLSPSLSSHQIPFLLAPFLFLYSLDLSFQQRPTRKMVVSESQAFLQDPLARLNSAFRDHIDGGGQRPSASFDYGVRDLINETFSNASQLERVRVNVSRAHANLKQIPDLWAEGDKVQTGQLVRLRCMIVDLNYDQEIYVGAYWLDEVSEFGHGP